MSTYVASNNWIRIKNYRCLKWMILESIEFHRHGNRDNLFSNFSRTTLIFPYLFYNTCFYLTLLLSFAIVEIIVKMCIENNINLPSILPGFFKIIILIIYNSRIFINSNELFFIKCSSTSNNYALTLTFWVDFSARRISNK